MNGLADPAGPRQGEPEHWRVRREQQSRHAIGEWEQILAATHVAFDVGWTERTPGRFRGSVVRWQVGELTLVDCMSAPFSGHYRAAAGEPGESSIGFQTLRRGAEHVGYKSAAVRVAAGDALVWNGSYPVDVEVVEPFMKRTLIFPRDRVLSVCPRLADLQALPHLGGSLSARLLSRYADALASELPTPETATVATAADVALELLRAAVEPGVPESRAARRDALRADVRRYIRRNLPDPGLSPQSIATAHAMSLRTLHALFEDSGESVAALVRRFRLARCLSDLARPSGGSVTDIAFRWGFTDGAHFSRVFRRELGLAPRDARRAMVADHGVAGTLAGKLER